MIKVEEHTTELIFTLDVRKYILDPQGTLYELGEFIRLCSDPRVTSARLSEWLTEGVSHRD